MRNEYYKQKSLPNSGKVSSGSRLTSANTFIAPTLLQTYYQLLQTPGQPYETSYYSHLIDENTGAHEKTKTRTGYRTVGSRAPLEPASLHDLIPGLQGLRAHPAPPTPPPANLRSPNTAGRLVERQWRGSDAAGSPALPSCHRHGDPSSQTLPDSERRPSEGRLAASLTRVTAESSKAKTLETHRSNDLTKVTMTGEKVQCPWVRSRRPQSPAASSRSQREPRGTPAALLGPGRGRGGGLAGVDAGEKSAAPRPPRGGLRLTSQPLVLLPLTAEVQAAEAAVTGTRTRGAKPTQLASTPTSFQLGKWTTLRQRAGAQLCAAAAGTEDGGGESPKGPGAPPGAHR